MNFWRKGIAAQFIKIWQWLLEMIFPAFCLGCNQEGNFLCEQCLKNIPRQHQQLCPLCYIQDADGKVCAACQRPDFYLDSVLAVSKFVEKSLLQKSIHALKYDFIEDLAEPLGKLLFETFCLAVNNNQADHQFIICPVPLHRKRLKWRGFNQAELLAKKLLQYSQNSAFNNVKLLQLLERIHFYRPQMELEREERLKNMNNAFMIQNEKYFLNNNQNITILLVDDIATTLATLNAAAKALKQAGAKYVFGLVLARVY